MSYDESNETDSDQYIEAAAAISSVEEGAFVPALRIDEEAGYYFEGFTLMA